MTNASTDAAVQDEQRAQTRLALGAMLIPLFFVAMFAVCIIGTYHKPHPNGIKVGVVGPAAQTAPLRAGIEKAAGSAFDISQVATVAEATHDVRQRDLDAAFVPTADPKQPATVIVAERRRPHRREGGRDARPLGHRGPGGAARRARRPPAAAPATSSGSASSCS